MFWDNVYQKMETATESMRGHADGSDNAIDDSFEWGGINLEDVLEYSYRPVTIEKEMGNYADKSSVAESTIETTWGDTLNVHPVSGFDETGDSNEKKEPIIMLGCGNSKMGEQMVSQHNGWRGPLIQVDIAKSALDMLSWRNRHNAQSSRLQFLHEDATHLSSIRNNSIEATVDKGLLDALFCADEYDQMSDIMKSVFRVLKPGGAFVVFSFSRPEFILPRMLPLHANAGFVPPRKTYIWHDLQIRESDSFLLYRFQKSERTDNSGFQEPKGRIRKRQ